MSFLLSGKFVLINFNKFVLKPALKLFGDIFDIINYRPILTIPYGTKIFEFLVYSRTSNRSLTHIMIDKQHDFRPGKSTITC